MAWQDDVAEQRRVSAAQRASQSSHKESIEAVEASGKGVVSATDKLAKTQDIDSLIKEVKELQLASLLGASKPSIVLTDQTDLGDRMTELGTKLVDTVAKLDTTVITSEQLSELKSLSLALIQLKTAIQSGDSDTKKAIDALSKVVSKLDMKPVITVPAPAVKIPATKVDLKPLQDTIERYMAPKEDDEKDIDLSCYRAQDIDNSPDKQYVGFVNPSGNWYIIENMVKENKLRYVFGNSEYAKAFANAPSFEYQLLNEALDALQA